MEPYLYAGNNPIMFIDPTGMSKVGADGPPDPPVKKGNQRGDKVLHIKYEGVDKSIYENDNNVLAKGYRMFKSIRKKTDELLSGGYNFVDDDSKPKGDQSLKKHPQSDQTVETVNVSGIMQLGSFAKVGEGMKYDEKDDFPIRFYSAAYSLFKSGNELPDAKITIPNNHNTYEAYTNQFGHIDARVKTKIIRDTTIMLKDIPKVLNKQLNRESRKQHDARYTIPQKK